MLLIYNILFIFHLFIGHRHFSRLLLILVWAWLLFSLPHNCLITLSCRFQVLGWTIMHSKMSVSENSSYNTLILTMGGYTRALSSCLKSKFSYFSGKKKTTTHIVTIALNSLLKIRRTLCLWFWKNANNCRRNFIYFCKATFYLTLSEVF